MDELDISFGKHRADTNWKPEYLSWDEFVARLRKIRITKETMAQYDAMTKAKKGDIKDGPAFVGGLVRGGRRRKQNIDSRSLITLDADNISPDDDFFFAVELVLGGCAYVIYSTHSHRPSSPRYRVAILPDRRMSPDEYSAVSRKLSEQIGMAYFDKKSFECQQLMYLPSGSKDAEVVLEVFEGEPLSVDGVLALYNDWQDVSEWPRHPKDKAGINANGTKAQDPREKNGVIGLFSRAFTIEEGIEEFLPDVYTPGTMPHRYTYTLGTSANGLEIYPDQELAYSHQDSDPIADGRTYNLFDLIRVHKFGHLDEAIHASGDPTQLPSYLAMKHWVAALDAVKKLQQTETTAVLQSEFSGESFESDEPLAEISKTIDLSKITVPFGFKIINEKLFEVKETKNDIKHIPVCDYLIAVVGRHINLTDGMQGLKVAWKKDKDIRRISSPRSTFMDSKKIINLADYGFPVHSGNARTLASYLSRFESENELLATELVSNQMGWVKGGFLLGERFIGNGDIKFLPKDAGDGQIAKGFHMQGAIEKTWEALEAIKPYTPVKLAVYAALAAPLLDLLGESSFIFELAGGTSKGKTTALRVAASLYGCPDEQKPGFFKQWNLTKVYVERYAATMNHLPLFVDDTKKADPRMVPATIYQFASGQGRGRGSLKGSQIGATWCTVLLSTGEQKLSSFSKDGGAVGRILSLHGSPFESTDLETGTMIEGLNELVSANYGHLGEPWIRFLMRLDKKEIKARIVNTSDSYKQLAASHGEVAMRLSRIMGILDTTGQLFDECFTVSLYDASTLRQEWLKILTGATEIDRALEALEDVMGWVAAHHRQFMMGEDKTHGGPILSGRIKEDEIIVIGEQLDDFLLSKGYEPTSMTKAWKDNGWLNTEEGRLKKKVRLAGGLTRAYSFNLQSVGWTYEFEKEYSEFGE